MLFIATRYTSSYKKTTNTPPEVYYFFGVETFDAWDWAAGTVARAVGGEQIMRHAILQSKSMIYTTTAN